MGRSGGEGGEPSGVRGKGTDSFNVEQREEDALGSLAGG